ncbi:unnamed protein product [Prorocentrum cordatum]|uniref:Cellulase n=1 Tax=Prorocentrum cordatum TaxID=2364126 RepID=A0ABN9Q9R4_9DINO|nr:unnamed protein product [Polarella glacialis]
MKCYKKNDYWSSCNQTCNPNYLWMETGWVKTDDTHWDCEVITIDSTDVSTDSDAGNAADAVASTDSECSPNGESCAQTMCCSEPGAKCYKKNDHWSSCNQTCDPFSVWEVDRWVVTNETVWDCEEVRPPCTPNGASCALSQCCSEPGAKCYKKNDYWSSCNQTCNPNYLWMETSWVKTNETVWDCEDLTVSPVESADPIADAEAEDEKGTCSQDGASCALSQCCSEPGSKCYKKNDHWSSCNQTCNPYYMWKDGGWVETNETVWDCEEVRPPCSQAGESCALTQCCSEPGASCYKKNDYWFACNLTCDPNSMWMEDRWVKTNETVWDCGVIAIESTDNATDAADTDAPADSASSSDASTASACSQNGESCAQTMCCSEPGAKCYKKNDHWSSCNQTCDPLSLWEVDRWVVTNETVWDCEEVRPPCSQAGESCALTQCCSEPGASCYKKNDYWFACNLTCDPNSMWMEDRWVKTNETVWDCGVIAIESTDNATDAADTDAPADSASSSDASTASACSQNGESCAQTMCCSEPGAKCYKKNDHWSSCNQTCDPLSLWEVDRWVVTNETVWDCEEVRPPCTPNGASCALSQCCSEPGAKCYKKNDYWSSCNQTCNPNYLWMETGWVVTNETVWDCEDLTVSPVESADPIADAEAEDQNNTCSQNGASCALSQCCAEPGSKCYKKNDYWSSCNQTCNPYYMWQVDRWVETNETVWDCEEVRPPCTPNGESCALSKCCSEPGMKCYKKNDHWSSCNQTCNPNYLWMETGWVKTNETVWDCEVITIDSTDVSTASDTTDSASSSDASTSSVCSPNGESCALTKCCAEAGSKCYKKNGNWSSCNQSCDPNSMWQVDRWVTTDEAVWDCEEVSLPCSPNGASCALSQCCSDPDSKCYKKNDHWIACNQTCDPNSMWTEGGWVVTSEAVWDCGEHIIDGSEASQNLWDWLLHLFGR